VPELASCIAEMVVASFRPQTRSGSVTTAVTTLPSKFAAPSCAVSLGIAATHARALRRRTGHQLGRNANDALAARAQAPLQKCRHGEHGCPASEITAPPNVYGSAPLRDEYPWVRGEPLEGAYR
jgi:hypothetical protein